MTQKFIRSIVIRKQFGEETAVFTCKPMTRLQALKVASLASGKGENEDVKDDELLAFFEMFSSSLEKFEGLTDASGVAITREDVLEHAYFTQLVAEAAGEWAREIMPKN